MTGAEVDWCQAFRNQTDNLDAYAERLGAGSYDLVVHYLQKTSHATGERLRPTAAPAGVRWADMPSAGRRGVIQALAGAVDA